MEAVEKYLVEIVDKLAELKDKAIFDIQINENELVLTNGSGKKSHIPLNLKSSDGVGIDNVFMENKNLLVKLTDGRKLDLGRVVGEDGKNGISIADANLIENHLVIKLENGKKIKLDEIKIPKGDKGKDGNEIEFAKIVGENLMIKMSDGRTIEDRKS